MGVRLWVGKWPWDATSLSVPLPVSLSVSVSVYVSVSLFLFLCLFVSVSLCLSHSLSLHRSISFCFYETYFLRAVDSIVVACWTGRMRGRGFEFPARSEIYFVISVPSVPSVGFNRTS